MIRRALISFAALFAMASTLSAYIRPEFESVKNRNFFLCGNNIAGMRADSVNISNAHAFGSYTFGENRSGYEAPQTWSAGAKASTIMHLKKFSMYGDFGFTHTTGYRMFTSMMVSPGRYPIGVLEFTPGTKTKQNYSFCGGISVDVAPQWRVGAKVDFCSTNYAKLKDLRYTNYALDLGLRPGVVWHDSAFTVGLALAIERNTETITAEQVGESSESYYAFLNKGLWYGTRQIWNSNGVHLSENGIGGFPIFEVGYGASAQFGWKGLYAELSYLHSDGKVGEKDAIWFVFPVDKVGGTLGYQMRSERGNMHTFKLCSEFKRTEVGENVIETESTGGVTVRHIMGCNRINLKSNLSLSPSWKGIFRKGEVEALVYGSYRNEYAVATIQYPRYDVWELHTFRLGGEAVWNCCSNGLSLAAGLYMGAGVLSEDSALTTDTVDSDTELYRSMKDYQAWKAVVTDPRFGGNIRVKYEFRNRIYVQADFSSEIRKLKFRTTAGIGLGYTF